jgi:hypothetical protein
MELGKSIITRSYSLVVICEWSFGIFHVPVGLYPCLMLCWLILYF